MNLIELAEKYNRLIRETDRLRILNRSASAAALSTIQPDFFREDSDACVDKIDEELKPLNLIAFFDAEASEQEIVLYKEERYQGQLERKFSEYQNKLDETGSISLLDISDLARLIVNEQKFCDGNHRTALFLCYHLALYANDQLLRIHPYLLYAAIDFEYLKSNCELTEVQGRIFSGNAINIALRSRAICKVYSPDIKAAHIDRITSETIGIPELLLGLSENNVLGSRGVSVTARKKLFCQFLGFRSTMCHSTSVSLAGYLGWLDKIKRIDCDFDPSFVFHKQPDQDLVPRFWKKSPGQSSCLTASSSIRDEAEESLPGFNF